MQSKLNINRPPSPVLDPQYHRTFAEQSIEDITKKLLIDLSPNDKCCLKDLLNRISGSDSAPDEAIYFPPKKPSEKVKPKASIKDFNHFVETFKVQNLWSPNATSEGAMYYHGRLSRSSLSTETIEMIKKHQIEPIRRTCEEIASENILAQANIQNALPILKHLMTPPSADTIAALRNMEPVSYKGIQYVFANKNLNFVNGIPTLIAEALLEHLQIPTILETIHSERHRLSNLIRQ